MNKDWSEKNKEIQKLLSKEVTFGEAIDKLIEFRGELFQRRHMGSDFLYEVAVFGFGVESGDCDGEFGDVQKPKGSKVKIIKRK